VNYIFQLSINCQNCHTTTYCFWKCDSFSFEFLLHNGGTHNGNHTILFLFLTCALFILLTYSAYGLARSVMNTTHTYFVISNVNYLGKSRQSQLNANCTIGIQLSNTNRV